MAMCKLAVRYGFAWGLGLSILLSLAPSAKCGPMPTVVIQPVIADAATYTSAFLSNQESYASAIFGQIGLALDFLTPITPATNSVPANYDGTNAMEPQLYFGSSSFQSPPILTVWLVGTITNEGVFDRGLTQQYGNDFGSWIADSTLAGTPAVNDTLAHEIGNDLSDLHEISGSPTNLMEVGTDRNIPSSLTEIHVGSNYDQITTTGVGSANQKSFMLGNAEFVQTDIPEPDSFVLGALGMLAMAGGARVFQSFRANVTHF
jgi:hypothetical protein